MKKSRIALCFFSLFFSINFLCGSENAQALKFAVLPFPKWWEPANLSIFRKAYPDVKFESKWMPGKNDWLITVNETPLYWAESRFLPEKYLEKKKDYRPVLYPYLKKARDPKTFTEKEIEKIKEYTSRESRSSSAIDSPFFFDAVFDCSTRAKTESHIVTVPLFTKTVNVHEKIAEPLSRVHKKVMKLPRDEEMDRFLSTLTRTDGFSWRTVRDTQSRSFHSIGLAIDILPKGYYQRIIYWGWQKQLRPDDWFMTPLEKRWSPPQRVIDIFMEEGFIWGGTWAVWDNMHFEYHPELLLYSKT